MHLYQLLHLHRLYLELGRRVPFLDREIIFIARIMSLVHSNVGGSMTGDGFRIARLEGV